MNPYVKTLRRIPKDIRLSMATRHIIPNNAECCMVGWAIRESLAFANGKGAEKYKVDDAAGKDVLGYPDEFETEIAARLFGGTEIEWAEIYYGVITAQRAEIEIAFAQVLDEACRG